MIDSQCTRGGLAHFQLLRNGTQSRRDILAERLFFLSRRTFQQRRLQNHQPQQRNHNGEGDDADGSSG